jgi:hypothetical protein
MTVKPEDYGAKYQDHLIEQYKLYAEMADNVSARRSQSNTFYITVLSGLLAVVAFAADKIPAKAQMAAFLAIGILGILLCITWYINLESYRQLNSGKYKVIHELEQKLPFSCYEREWAIMNMKDRADKPKYKRLTWVEKLVPVLMALPFLFLSIYSINYL